MADLKKILIEFTEFLELHGAEGIRKGVEMYVEEFERTNDTVKDHLFMIDVITGEANERHELKEALEMIAYLQYDEIPGEFGASDFAKKRLFELGIENNEQDYLGRA